MFGSKVQSESGECWIWTNQFTCLIADLESFVSCHCRKQNKQTKLKKQRSKDNFKCDCMTES